MNLQHADVRRILELLDTPEHLDSLDLRIGDVVLQALNRAPRRRVRCRSKLSRRRPPRHPGPRPGRDAAARAGRLDHRGSPALAEVPDRMIAIRAPMPGTSYRTPAPTEPPFVEEGQQIEASATLCLIEVMKMFNSDPTPTAGRVRSILVEHGQAVEHEQILMIFDPHDAEAAA